MQRLGLPDASAFVHCKPWHMPAAACKLLLLSADDSRLAPIESCRGVTGSGGMPAADLQAWLPAWQTTCAPEHPWGALLALVTLLQLADTLPCSAPGRKGMLMLVVLVTTVTAVTAAAVGRRPAHLENPGGVPSPPGWRHVSELPGGPEGLGGPGLHLALPGPCAHSLRAGRQLCTGSVQGRMP